jgi:hypothetical protein
MPDDDSNRIEGRPIVAAQKPRRALVALLVTPMLPLIVIATLTVH